MTPEQRDSLLGLAFGFSAIGAGFVFILGALMADTIGQAFAYAGLSFIGIFALVRHVLIRIGNSY